MRTILIFLTLVGIYGLEPKYGDKDQELIIGNALDGIVNTENPFVFAPWGKETKIAVDAIKCEVEYTPLITVRNAPWTYRVILASCTAIHDKSIVFRWAYRDDWEDGAIYRKLTLPNGIYTLSIHKNGNINTIVSLSK
jgi:hypothetical protein